MTKTKVIDYHFKQPNATLVAIGAKFVFKSTMPADLDALYNIIASPEMTIQTNNMFKVYRSILEKKCGYKKPGDLPTGNIGQFAVISCDEKTGKKGPGDKFYLWTVQVTTK